MNNEAMWFGALSMDGALPGQNDLADAARSGDWARVLHLCRDRPGLVNTWRPEGTSLFTPLHQAAWHGAPADVILGLLDLGAWRSIRTADGRRPLEIALEKRHGQLSDLLGPVSHHEVDDELLGWLDLRLAELVESRIRPHLDIRLRHPSTEVLTEVEDGSLWYAVPGMYGGFHICLREAHLYVRSWSRVVQGSGEAHLVHREGCVLVESGFV